jgi:hypothetical protein
MPLDQPPVHLTGHGRPRYTEQSLKVHTSVVTCLLDSQPAPVAQASALLSHSWRSTPHDVAPTIASEASGLAAHHGGPITQV